MYTFLNIYHWSNISLNELNLHYILSFKDLKGFAMHWAKVLFIKENLLFFSNVEFGNFV